MVTAYLVMDLFNIERKPHRNNTGIVDFHFYLAVDVR